MKNDLIKKLLAQCSFPVSGSKVDCAVSGGADSLALLLLAVEASLEVTVWHVDHGLRSSSSSEGLIVADIAKDLGAEAHCVKSLVLDGPNLEARARDARISVLPAQVLTGHTADDQAETVILNLLRGSGLQGTSGIGEPDRRPLLNLRRAETEKLCLSMGLEPVCDSMNFDSRFTRNRIRSEVIPLLAEVAGRDPVPILTRHALLAEEAVGLLESLTESIDVTDVKSVAGTPDELVRLAIHHWLTINLGFPADFASVKRVLHVVRGGIRATEISGGYRVSRSKGKLKFFVNPSILSKGI